MPLTPGAQPEPVALSVGVHRPAWRRTRHGPGHAGGRAGPWSYLGAATLVALAAALRWALDPWLNGAAIYLAFLPALVVSGLLLGPGPAVVALALSALATNLLFLGPRFVLVAPSPPEYAQLGVFLFVGLLILLIVRREWRSKAGALAHEREARAVAAALRESERRLSEIVRTMPAFVAVVRGPDLVFELANESYYELVGRRNILGKTVLEALPEIASQPFPELLRRVYATGEPYIARGTRVLLARTPGEEGGEGGETGAPLEERCLDFAYTPLRGPDGSVSGIVMYGVDFTERVRAEEGLRAAQGDLETRVRERTAELTGTNRFLEALLENVQDGIVACDADGILTLFNRATREFHGLPLEPLPAERWAEHYDLYRADGRTPLAKGEVPLFRALAGERVRGAEMVIAPKGGGGARTLTASGRAFHDERGRTLGAVVSMHDITERKRAEEALRRAHDELEARVGARTAELARANDALRVEFADRKRAEDDCRHSEARLRIALDAARMVAWEWDAASRTLTRSENAAEILGIGAGGGEGEPGSREGGPGLIHPDDVDRHRALVERAIAARTGYVSEYRLVRPDTGEAVWVEDHAKGSFNASGRLVRLSGVMTDVSARKRVDEELARYRDQLETLVMDRTAELRAMHQKQRLSERMAAIGTLSAGLGHDMGNLLLPIRARLDVVRSRELPPDVKESLDAIGTCAEYLLALARGLRLFALDPDDAGASAGTTELESWRRDATPFFKNVLQKAVAFEVVCATDLSLVPRIGVAPHRLTQAVLNLVNNARDAIGPGKPGRVTLSVAPAPDGESVCVRVADDGPGMTPEVRHRALEPFFTTKTRGVSTGLGLSLVRGIVQAAGGQIEIDSAPGRGASVTMTFPGVVEIADPSDQAEGGKPGDRQVFVSIANDRIAALACNIVASVGLDPRRLTLDHPGPWAGPTGGRIWITDGSPGRGGGEGGAFHAAAGYLGSDPGRRVVVVGERAPEWGALGDGVLFVGPVMTEIRSALHRALSEQTDGPDPVADELVAQG